MIVVRVELWPLGNQAAAKEIGRMLIVNEGGTTQFGDYGAYLTRRGAPDVVQRSAGVARHPRLTQSVWRLVEKALHAIHGENHIKCGGSFREAYKARRESRGAQ